MTAVAFLYAFLAALVGSPTDDDMSVSLWWVLVVLAIIALLVFIFTRFRR